jgi:hypothetical protein
MRKNKEGKNWSNVGGRGEKCVCVNLSATDVKEAHEDQN